MLHTWMEQNVLLYGMAGLGILGIFCMIAVSHFYNQAIRDLGRMDEPKGRWMRHFLEEFGKRKARDQNLRNPEAFVRTQITAGRIFGTDVRRWKQGITLCSVLCLGVLLASMYGAYQLEWPQLRRFQYLLVGVGVISLLLFLKQSMDFLNKEDVLMDGLLDYTENVSLPPSPRKDAKEDEEKIREELIGRMTKGLAQNAATSTKFSHLLSPDEEKIMKQVIREYLLQVS